MARDRAGRGVSIDREEEHYMEAVRSRRRTRPREAIASRDITDLWALRAEMCVLRRRAQATLPVRDPSFGLDFLDDSELDDVRSIRTLRRLERVAKAKRPQRRGVVLRNAQLLAEQLALDPVHADVLALLAAGKTHTALRRNLRRVLRGDMALIFSDLAFILDRDREHVAAALRTGGVLRDAGIIELSTDDAAFVAVDLDDSIARTLCQEHSSPDALTDSYFRRAPDATLRREQFEHARELVDALLRVLGGALAQQAVGVNLLVHGAPGTGKTQLARLLAQVLGAPLFEVRGEDEHGEPLTGAKRLVGFGMTQRVLARRGQAIVLFDEAEDAFAGPPMFALLEPTPATTAKAWRVRLLENNPRPSIWLSNNIRGFDPAILRRFDVIFELRRPPERARREILATRLDGLGMSDAWLERAAADERLTPALADGIGETLRLAGDLDAAERERLATRVLDGLLDTQGSRTARAPSRPAAYDLRFVNASINLEQVVRGLVARPQGSLCLFGPSGTGKSEFACHLARCLGRPLVRRRASDLFAKFVGETEANIARMFREARDADAVLVLDEADGFLRDRTLASRSWEVTQVNELLVQMEAFEGVFVCTTNLVETFDVASLRRFDLKVRFEPLTEAQRWELFVATLRDTGAELLADGVPHAVRSRLRSLDGLTPGDFATVVRRARALSTSIDSASLVHALEQEWKAKPHRVGRALGFR